MTGRSNQKDERGVSNQSNSCREFAFVSSTVGASRFVSILGQLQLLQSPLNHLQDTKSEWIRKRDIKRWYFIFNSKSNEFQTAVNNYRLLSALALFKTDFKRAFRSSYPHLTITDKCIFTEPFTEWHVTTPSVCFCVLTRSSSFQGMPRRRVYSSRCSRAVRSSNRASNWGQ